MIRIERVLTSDMDLNQFTTFKTHNNFNSKHKVTKEIAILVISIFRHARENIHCLILLQNIHEITNKSGQLWVVLRLYSNEFICIIFFFSDTNETKIPLQNICNNLQQPTESN